MASAIFVRAIQTQSFQQKHAAGRGKSELQRTSCLEIPGHPHLSETIYRSQPQLSWYQVTSADRFYCHCSTWTELHTTSHGNYDALSEDEPQVLSALEPESCDVTTPLPKHEVPFWHNLREDRTYSFSGLIAVSVQGIHCKHQKKRKKNIRQQHSHGSIDHDTLPGPDPLVTTVPHAETGFAYSISKGRAALVAWKNTAGKAKAWRRCSKVARNTNRPMVGGLPYHGDYFRSPLWLPQGFVAFQKPLKFPQKRNMRRCKVSEQRKHDRKHPHIQSMFDSEHVCSSGYMYDHYNEPEHHNDPAIDLVEYPNSVEPPPGFLRLIWKDFQVSRIDDYERFLPSGLTVTSRWHIQSFLRNDSHADVYSIQDAQHPCKLPGVVALFEGHYFLAEYDGNGERYAKRHRSRMQRTRAFVEQVWLGGRSMIIMSVPECVTTYNLRYSREEFPALAGRNTESGFGIKQHYRSDGKPSYAAILKGVEATKQIVESSRAGIPRLTSQEQTRNAKKQRLKRRRAIEEKKKIQSLLSEGTESQAQA